MGEEFWTMGVKRSFRRPALVVSRCIEFDPVRYNGDMISCPLVRSMKPFVTFIFGLSGGYRTWAGYVGVGDQLIRVPTR